GFAYQTLPLGPSGAATVTGAFHCIHLTRSMNSSINRTCSFPDMSDQIHCLVEASPCSIGLAEGRPRPSLNPNTSVIKINKQSRLDVCIQAMAYPLWHKVYLNSIQGFAAVNGEELQLAGCETDLAQPGLLLGATPAGLLIATLPLAGFVNLPST